MVQELLTNARLHSHAARIQVTLDIENDLVHATVEDNGGGFEPKEVLGPNAPRKTLGLPTQRERVEMLGGHLTIESSIGRGTRVTLEMPASDGKV